MILQIIYDPNQNFQYHTKWQTPRTGWKKLCHSSIKMKQVGSVSMLSQEAATLFISIQINIIIPESSDLYKNIKNHAMQT